MVGRDAITEACQTVDAAARRGDPDAYWRERGVEVAALAETAMQRGARAVAILRGEDLSDPHRLATAFASMFMDGFAVRDGISRSPAAPPSAA